MDLDASGQISLEEFLRCMKDPKIVAYMSSINAGIPRCAFFLFLFGVFKGKPLDRVPSKASSLSLFSPTMTPGEMKKASWGPQKGGKQIVAVLRMSSASDPGVWAASF